MERHVLVLAWRFEAIPGSVFGATYAVRARRQEGPFAHRSVRCASSLSAILGWHCRLVSATVAARGWPERAELAAMTWGRFGAALRRLADPVAQLVVWFGLLVVSKDMGSNPDRLGNGAPPGATDVERYVSRRELASIMGVSLATVDRMVAEGLPSVTWGRRTRRFKPSMAISWATERGTAA
jgi:hypothetical protein